MNFYLPKTVVGGVFLDSLYVSKKPTLAKSVHMNIYVKEPPLSEYEVCLDYMSLELAFREGFIYGRLIFQPPL